MTDHCWYGQRPSLKQINFALAANKRMQIPSILKTVGYFANKRSFSSCELRKPNEQSIYNHEMIIILEHDLDEILYRDNLPQQEFDVI